MRNNNDSLVARFLQNVFHCARVVRNNAQCVNALSNQVFYNLNLLRRVCFSRSLLEYGHTGIFFLILRYAFLHADKPRVRTVLRNNSDRIVPVAFRRAAVSVAGCR